MMETVKLSRIRKIFVLESRQEEPGGSSRVYPSVRVIRSILLVAGSIFIGLYAYIAFQRMSYPFKLDWLEGSSYIQVLRILEGKSLYVEPSMSYVPILYTPLYYYLGALFSLLFSPGLFSLRLLSFLFSVGCFILIYRIVLKETAIRYFSVLAMCLFAATFKLSGAWFDLARVDSVLLFFLLLSIHFLQYRNSRITPVFAAIFITLAVLTKQTAVCAGLFMFLYLFFSNRIQALIFGLVTTILISVVIPAFNSATDGWFAFYIFKIPAHHRLFLLRWRRWHLLLENTFLVLPVVMMVIVAYFYIRNRLKRNTFPLFTTLIPAGLFLTTLLTFMHAGGYNNAFMPVYAAMSILFGIGLKFITEHLPYLVQRKQFMVTFSIYILCLIQFGVLVYNPSLHLPTERDLKQGQKLVSTLANIEGEVYIPDYPMLLVMAGKTAHAQRILVWDIIQGDEKIRNRLIREEKKWLLDQKFEFVITSSNPGFIQKGSNLRLIDIAYKYRNRIFKDRNVFFTKTGKKTRPQYFYVKKERAGRPVQIIY